MVFEVKDSNGTISLFLHELRHAPPLAENVNWHSSVKITDRNMIIVYTTMLSGSRKPKVPIIFFYTPQALAFSLSLFFKKWFLFVLVRVRAHL